MEKQSQPSSPLTAPPAPLLEYQPVRRRRVTKAGDILAAAIGLGLAASFLMVAAILLGGACALAADGYACTMAIALAVGMRFTAATMPAFEVPAMIFRGIGYLGADEQRKLALRQLLVRIGCGVCAVEALIPATVLVASLPKTTLHGKAPLIAPVLVTFVDLVVVTLLLRHALKRRPT